MIVGGIDIEYKLNKNLALLHNSILFDFGINPKDNGNKTILQNLIGKIDQTFDLIMIVEDFNESMVLLKDGLSWNYEDLLSIKLNVHNEMTKSVISEKAKNSLRKWLKASYIFYDYFKVSKLTYITHTYVILILMRCFFRLSFRKRYWNLVVQK